MEKDVNYSTEVIRKFPTNPDLPIIYVSYNKDMSIGAENLIRLIHGDEYFDEHVRVACFDTLKEVVTSIGGHCDIYFDPTVYVNRSNGYN